MADPKKLDLLWDDNPVDITPEANFIWSIANKLRGFLYAGQIRRCDYSHDHHPAV